MRPRRDTRKGVTLLEALLAAAVVTMVAADVFMPCAAAARARRTLRDARQTVAVNLARDMVEDIPCECPRDPRGDESGGDSPAAWKIVVDVKDHARAARAS